MSYADCFSADYGTARARFLEAARSSGALLWSEPVGGRGPDGEPLTIDVARLGAEVPRRVVVVTSALHGVEGFLGSAVQQALLEGRLASGVVSDGLAIVLIHALNPYGYAYTRRVDRRNIDLNRNFLPAGEDYVGSPALYGKLDPLLNPAQPPGSAALFLLRAAGYIARYGMPALKDAVAGGQYDFPQGLFFGGSGASETHQVLDRALPRWIGSPDGDAPDRVIHLDFHTGLGAWGTYKLMVDHVWGSAGLGELAGVFGDGVEPWEPEKGVSYQIRGGLGAWAKARFPDTSYDVLCAEFGTSHILRVLTSLHMENRAHHHDEASSAATARAKGVLRETFAPKSERWRQRTAGAGVDLVDRALDALT